jgi:hypothetical protein
MEWEQDEILRPLFGWKRWDGTAALSQAWIEVPRKNDKTTLAAGIALYLTFADGEPGAEVYARRPIATRRGSASASQRRWSRARRRSPRALRDLYALDRRPATFSKYKVLSADAFTKHGLNAHGIVVDEVHAQKTRELIDVLHTSTGSRRQPLEVYITTAGHDRHSIAYEMHEHALRVLEDPTRSTRRCSSSSMRRDPTDDWKEPEATWRKANPGLGRSKKWDYMRAECNRAIQIPGYENTFKRLDLNIWTEQASRWLPMEKWDLCVGPIADPLKLRDAMRGQNAGAVWTWRIRSTSTLSSSFSAGQDAPRPRPVFLDPGGAAARARARSTAFPGRSGSRPASSRSCRARFRLRHDPLRYRGARQDLPARGDRDRPLERAADRDAARERPAARAAKARAISSGAFRLGVGQGYASMTTPCKALEAAVVGLRLEHGAHPVLRWMASNVAAQRDAADNIKPDKEASAEKIDGISAVARRPARALVHQPQGLDRRLAKQSRNGRLGDAFDRSPPARASKFFAFATC